MLKIILIIIGILFALFIVALLYSACVVSSKYNELMKEYQSDISCENEEDENGVTSLENQTLESLLELYEEGGVNFIINDGKVVDYEVE